MGQLLRTEELESALSFKYGKNTVLKESKIIRKKNVLSFNELSRDDLTYGKIERKLCLYETVKGEKIYIQYPGKESVRSNPQMPFDFRPVLELCNGTFLPDVSFGDIWDILNEIGTEQKKQLPFVAALFVRLGYMYGYCQMEKEYNYYDIDIEKNKIVHADSLFFKWYALELSKEVWNTLNDRVGNVKLAEGLEFSFEAFIKFVDLLFQNEDCKYYYKNVIVEGKEKYSFSNGRTKSSAANLLIINHLEGNTRLSKLLNSFQKSRGVPDFKKSDYAVVTNNMIINIDFQ